MSKLFAPMHTEKIFDPAMLSRTVTKSVTALKKLRTKVAFNALAVCGNSGIVIGSILAQKLKVPLIVVRKKMDQCHDDNRINGLVPNDCRYLVVDDLISSGMTLEHILSGIYDAVHSWNDYADTYEWKRNQVVTQPQPVGVFLYNQTMETPPQWTFSSWQEHPAIKGKSLDLYILQEMK